MQTQILDLIEQAKELGLDDFLIQNPIGKQGSGKKGIKVLAKLPAKIIKKVEVKVLDLLEKYR